MSMLCRKIKRRDSNAQIETNYITSKVEVHIDKIKQAVENMISIYADVND